MEETVETAERCLQGHVSLPMDEQGERFLHLMPLGLHGEIARAFQPSLNGTEALSIGMLSIGDEGAFRMNSMGGDWCIPLREPFFQWPSYPVTVSTLNA